MSVPPLDFFRDTGSVRWYRGMSRVQTGACDDLLHALRDDTEQGSTYRVRRCLSQLGLHPLVRSPQISAIMGISQGNDLAFLWFLWEAAYKQPRGKHEECDPTSYTVNEQLLLSGIAHLDMPSTLRALDTLLPPACHSKKPKPQCLKGLKKTAVRLRIPRARNEDVLPYFDTQVRPRPFTPRGRYRPPEMKLQFPEYSEYANRMHEIPNERGRWFADYQLCPGKRVIKNLLTEELNRLLDPNRVPLEKPVQLCETHRIVEGVVNVQRQEKVYEVYRRCLAQLDVPGSEQRARRKWIVADLEREIECAAEKIRGESRRLLSKVKTLRNKGGSASCELCHLMVSSPAKCTGGRADLSLLLGLGTEDEPKAHAIVQEETDDEVKFKVLLLQRNDPTRCGAGDCRFAKPVDLPKVVEEEVEVEPEPVRKSKKLKKKSSKPGKKSKKTMTPLEEPPIIPPPQKLADLIPACSRTLPCLMRSKPRNADARTFTTRSVAGIGLDYSKIYDLPGIPDEHLGCEDPDYVDVEDKQPVIKKLCIAALNDGQSQKVKEFRKDELLSPVLRAAATCAVDIFRTKLAEDPEPIKLQPEDLVVKRDELIDPNNRQQLEDILKAALQVLQSNPHFVLASFPNAHKLPVLIDWVADRYGKTFSQEEMNVLIKSTFNIYERIYKGDQDHQRQVLQLRRGISSLNGEVTYRNLKNFLCLTRQRRGKYHSKLNELALEQSRLTWLALRGYSNLGGQIRDTFFAYMPARESDLKREHIWRSSDYRNMVMNRLKAQTRRGAA